MMLTSSVFVSTEIKTLTTQIVAIGEILWDVFPDGAKFGGAPANFACSASELSDTTHHVHIVSAVGDDELGKRALESLAERGVNTDHVQVNQYPTGRVDVSLDSAGIASYRFAENCAWDHLTWSPTLASLARSTDAVCFGTLGQRSEKSRITILEYLKHTPPNCLRVFDVNIRRPYFEMQWVIESMRQANVLKLNDDELPVLAELCDCSGDELEIARKLLKEFKLDLLALTRGDRGSLLVTSSESVDFPGQPVHVVDTVGAGDAFTASLTINQLRDKDLKSMTQHANQVAAYVCANAGATMHFPEDLKP